MKLLGQTVGDYAATGAANPGAYEASVNFTVSSTTGTPQEEAATSGSVKLVALDPAARASGSFDLTFPDGTLSGTFDATWCSAGHEP